MFDEYPHRSPGTTSKSCSNKFKLINKPKVSERMFPEGPRPSMERASEGAAVAELTNRDTRGENPLSDNAGRTDGRTDGRGGHAIYAAGLERGAALGSRELLFMIARLWVKHSRTYKAYRRAEKMHITLGKNGSTKLPHRTKEVKIRTHVHVQLCIGEEERQCSFTITKLGIQTALRFFQPESCSCETGTCAGRQGSMAWNEMWKHDRATRRKKAEGENRRAEQW